MRKIKPIRGIFTSLLIAWTTCLSAQTFTNNGAVITTQRNAIVTIQGSLESLGAGLLRGEGALEVSGDVQNLGTTGLTDTTTSVVLNGSNAQTIGGTQPSAFYNVKLDNAAGASLNQHVHIRDAFEMASGALDLNGQDLVLGLNGRIDSETNANRIFGATGSIRTKRPLNIPTGNTAAMGLNIQGSGTLGETEIIRRHNVQTIGGGSSIERNYEVIAPNASNLNMDVTINYFDAELNGQVPANLQFFQNNGVWVNKAGTSDPNANTVEAFGLNELGLMTLSSDGTVSRDRDLAQQMVKAYPNPINAGESVWVAGLEPGSYAVRLLDLKGRELTGQAITVSGSSSTTSITLPILPTGMYMLQFNQAHAVPFVTKITIN